MPIHGTIFLPTFSARDLQFNLLAANYSKTFAVDAHAAVKK